MARTDHWYDRLTTASSRLLGDDSIEAGTLLSLLIDVGVVSDELLTALEAAEEYLRKKGEV